MSINLIKNDDGWWLNVEGSRHSGMVFLNINHNARFIISALEEELHRQDNS